MAARWTGDYVTSMLDFSAEKRSAQASTHPLSQAQGELFCLLLYIQLTISFLIGRKRSVNFRNQRLGHHLAADYTIIMSRKLKATSNHVMYDRDE